MPSRPPTAGSTNRDCPTSSTAGTTTIQANSASRSSAASSRRISRLGNNTMEEDETSRSAQKRVFFDFVPGICHPPNSTSAILILRGRAVLNPRFPMKPRWFAPLREGDAPEGQGEYSVQSPHVGTKYSPRRFAPPPLGGGACVCFRHSAVIQQGPPPKAKMRIAGALWIVGRMAVMVA